VTSWNDVAEIEPHLAERVRALFEAHRFRIDITEVVLTRVGTPADHLLIESWHPGRGLQRLERR
jgi:hypothetical protein